MKWVGEQQPQVKQKAEVETICSWGASQNDMMDSSKIK
jgi:hypothetical protein